MDKPIRYRHVNEAVGAFVLIVALLLVGSVVLTGRVQNWFEPVTTFEILLPEEGSMGLQVGSGVQVLGTQVGRVRELRVDQTGQMRAVVSVRGDFMNFVRTDSEVLIRRKYGVAGDAYIEITRGDGRYLAESDVTLRAQPPTDFTAELQTVVREFSEVGIPMLESIDNAANSIARLTDTLNDPTGDLRKTLARIEAMTAGLQRAEGLLGKLLRDPEVAQRFEEILADTGSSMDQLNALLAEARKAAADLPEITSTLRSQSRRVPEMIDQVHKSLEQTRQIVADVGKATAPLPGMVRTVQAEIKALPGLVLNLQKTVDEILVAVRAVQRHWLIRDYVRDEAPAGRIPPGQVLPVRPAPTETKGDE